MTIIATGVLAGHEARGTIAVVVEGTSARVELSDMSVPTTAPDMRLYAAARTDGVVDETATDLGVIPDGVTEISVELPDHVDPKEIGSVIVYCRVYSVLFGFGPVTYTL